MRVWASLWLVVCIAACTTSPTPLRSNLTKAPTEKQWQGRISVTVQSDPPRNMSSGFTLEGDTRFGRTQFILSAGDDPRDNAMEPHFHAITTRQSTATF